MFCLVAIHNLVGENVLFQYLQELNGSKVWFYASDIDLLFDK